MGNIFGDTDDITFGSENFLSGPSSGMNGPKKRETSSFSPKPLLRKPYPSRSSDKSSGFVLPQAPTLRESLTSLIKSMKPTYFPPLGGEALRMTILSPSSHPDPLVLVRTGDVTLLVGTGFSEITSAGKSYPTFPDLRLIESEKDHLAGWVLLLPGFHVELFALVLEMLDFPFVYATRDVIAYIRDNIKSPEFLDKCRFFELFTPMDSTRKIADFTLQPLLGGISIMTKNAGYVDLIRTSDDKAHELTGGQVALTVQDGQYRIGTESGFDPGEILDILGSKITKHSLKFTFDTFFLDEKSVGVVAGYALKDREELASSGVLTFVLEEDIHARAIVGHIFIDSRGFVHSYEMMSVHKQILKGIRHIYEETILANPRIERGQLVQILRRDLTKYCFLITGRTPVVMPIIIER